MLTDRPITISTGRSRRDTEWPSMTLLWSELAARLSAPAEGVETMEEYLALGRAEQDERKDVGGFVGGALASGRRKAGCVLMRDVVTLDLDRIPPGGAQDTLRRIESLGCACAVYSTRKHRAQSPRLRAVLPLDEPCGAAEYEPIARMCAKGIGIGLCDPTTFEAGRLMYWPSVCRGGEFVYRLFDGALLGRLATLDLYADWRDAGQWPRAQGGAPRAGQGGTLGDPAEKPGVVGAFCRRYDVPRAIAELLPGVYEPAGTPGRYTYKPGSTCGGAVVYDGGRFLCSFHATDPCGGREVNSFDLVRLHRFGGLDAGYPPDTPYSRLPSDAAMREFARSLPEVAALAGGDGAGRDFAEGRGWTAVLASGGPPGRFAKTVDNVVLILEHDPRLMRSVVFDEFSQRAYVTGGLPWEPYGGRPRVWRDSDDSQLVRYVEKAFGIGNDQKVFHGLAAYLGSHTVNCVRDYLDGLEWDRKPRLDTLFIDYLGAQDTAYARSACRKAFTAAAARAYRPGVKYDAVPILHGSQGIGKSTVLAVMGGDWYCDSLVSFDGKEAAELIQGMWIIELGELAALARTEIEAAKHFITKKDDQFRVPYGRRANVFPRRCVFFGTTNRGEHLRDATGNRRFWPLDCDGARRTKSPWDDLPRERDQLWAEAAWRWKAAEEPLFFGRDLESAAFSAQREHLELDPRAGLVAAFVERPLPEDWMRRAVPLRLRYWGRPPDTAELCGMTERRTVSRQEIWVECFRRDPADITRRDAQEIDGILMNLPGWERHSSSFRNGPYGTEKGYARSGMKSLLYKTTSTG